MDRDRQVQCSASVPHWIKARIVHLDERTGGEVLAQIESQGLQDLQSPRTCLFRTRDFVRWGLWVICVMAAAPQWFGKGQETSRIRLVVSLDAFGEAGTCPTRKVHHRTNVLAIHDLQQLFRRGEKFSLLSHRNSLFTLERESQMGVDVDDGKAGALDRMRGNMQHASGFEFPKVETCLLTWIRRLRFSQCGPRC